jgi:hypothetical protein
MFLWLIPVIALSYFGYGSDEDAWIVGQEALQCWNTGHYTVSRSTGFPLHELLMAPLSAWGAWYACNAFSILSGLILLFFTWKQSSLGIFRQTTWVIITLAFLPQVLVNASSTLDYIPSLACWAAMYYFFLKKKYYYAALCVGLACGFRPSNGAFILPVCWWIGKERGWKEASKIFVLALLTGMLAYSPVLIHYGILDPTREVSIPWQQNILIGAYQMLILLGIAPSLYLAFLFLKKRNELWQGIKNNGYWQFHLLHMGIWLLFFWGITSSESEYLFPIIPSMIYLCDRWLENRWFKITCVVLLSYNFISLELLGGESGNRKIALSIQPGFTWRDWQDRRFKLWFREAATAYSCQEKTLLMFGSAYVLANNPQWEFAPGHPNIIKQKNGNFYISERILDVRQLQRLKAEGITMFVWKQRKWEYLRLEIPHWNEYVRVADDLELFLRSKSYGKLMQ